MITAPLNDEACLSKITAWANTASRRADIRELAQRLGTREAVIDHIRSLPQLDDGATDDTPGPRIACDVPQRVRINPLDPNCVERSVLAIALLEVLEPGRTYRLMTIDLAPGVRHTFPVESYVDLSGDPMVAPLWLEPAVPRNALAAGLHLVRNARGDHGGLLAPLDALSWAVGLAGDVAAQSGRWVARHQRALQDVARIAAGKLPRESNALGWALRLAVPEALAFGPDGEHALLSAAGLLDELLGPTPSTPSSPSPSPSSSSAASSNATKASTSHSS